MAADAIMTEIMAAIALLMEDRAAGLRDLEAIWARIRDAPEPYHECVLSHYMADVQDDVSDELAWDTRALNAALRACDTAAQPAPGMPSIATFMPSLHLNLAQDYFKLGDVAQSKTHLAAARDVAGSLPADGYGQMIRAGIAQLAAKLGAT